MTRKRSADDEPPDPEKKERVIHTRVPESLEAQLREKAQGLGISVSNLVRNVLGHAFGLVGDVVADSHAIARAARSPSPSSSESGRGSRSGSGSGSSDPAAVVLGATTTVAALDDVLGWQPIVLGKNAVCARCNDVLLRGRDAATGVSDTGSARFVICLACLEQLRAESA